MFKSFFALFVVVASAGCTVVPVQYAVPVYQQPQSQLMLPQAPMPAGIPASPPIVVPVTPAPGVVYLQQPPVYMYNPIIDIATGYLIWRSLSGGWHGGHRHR